MSTDHDAIASPLGAASPQSRTDVPCGSHAPSSTVDEGSDERPLALSEVELAPLPNGWIREGHATMSEGRMDSVGVFFRTHDCYIGPNGVMPPTGVVSVHGDGVRVSSNRIPPADLITVLRHAEREHQRLQAGGGR